MDREKGLPWRSCRMAPTARTRRNRQAHARRQDAQKAKSLGCIQGVTRSQLVDARVDTHVLKWTDLTLSLCPYAMENSTTVLFFTERERERELYCIVFDMCSVMQFGFFPEERNCDWQQVYSIYDAAWRGSDGSAQLLPGRHVPGEDARRSSSIHHFVVSRGPHVACCVWAALLPHRLGKKLDGLRVQGRSRAPPRPMSAFSIRRLLPFGSRVLPRKAPRSASACARSLGLPPHLPHPWLTVVLVLQIAADLLHEGLE